MHKIAKTNIKYSPDVSKLTAFAIYHTIGLVRPSSSQDIFQGRVGLMNGEFNSLCFCDL